MWATARPYLRLPVNVAANVPMPGDPYVTALSVAGERPPHKHGPIEPSD